MALSRFLGVVLLLLVMVWPVPGNFVSFTSPGSSPTAQQELQSALAMSQLVLAQQAKFFGELINITKNRGYCCNEFENFKSGKGTS